MATRCLTLILAALCCAGSARSADLTVYETTPPFGLTPFSSRGQVSARLTSLIFRPLYRYSYWGDFEQPLADRSRAEGDNVLLVDIRPDAWFYQVKPAASGISPVDSTPVTAADVVATYQLFTNRQSDIISSWHTDRFRSRIREVTAADERTVRFHFRAGKRSRSVLDFPVIPRLGYPGGVALSNPPKGTPQERFENRPYGAGPYHYDWNKSDPRDDIYILRRHAAVAREKIESISITIVNEQHLGTLLQTTSPHPICVPEVPLNVINQIDLNRYETKQLYPPVIDQIIFNLRHPPLDDPRVRQALSMCINRTKLIRSLRNQADPITGPMPSGTEIYDDSYSPPYYRYDTVHAAQLLDEAGWRSAGPEAPRAKNGRPLEIELLGFTGTRDSYIAQLISQIAAAWKAIGVKVTERTETQSRYWRFLKERKFDATFHRLQYFIVPDISRHFLPGATENYSGLNDPLLASVWNDSLPPAPVTDTKRLWHKMHRMIGDAVPCAFLWAPRNYAAYSHWLDVGHDWRPHNFLYGVEHWKADR